MALALQDVNGHTIQAVAPGTPQNVTIGASSTQSTAFGSDTTLIRLCPSVTCWIEIGANPTATTAKVRLPADSIEYFKVTPGHKVAVIQDSAGGTLNVVECA